MFLALISIGINGLPIIGKALTGLWKKKVNVDELVSIAIIACLISGEFLTAATVSFVMVLGALIEEATSESARKAIRSLINITPKSATVINNGQEELKPITEVRVGDILLVKPGECIPVDAVIINGSSAVDESSITGEPIPIEKIKGDYVYSGTITQNGVLKIKTTKIGEDTTLGKVIKLVSEAEAHKPVSVKLIDRYAKWFTPAILCCAAFNRRF
jgi:Cd2+/Zn2+-exporting ATPase